MEENKFRRRSFLHFAKETKTNKAEFVKAPLKHPKLKIGYFTMVIPFMNGKAAALVIPNNYCQHDLEIILAQLEVIKMSVKK